MLAARKIVLSLPLLALPLLASCVEPRTVQAPVAEATPPVVALAPPPVQDWRDGPVTAGAWSYAGQPGGSTATYAAAGTPLFAMRCAGGDVALVRAGATRLTITTTSVARAVTPAADGVAHLPPRDSFLDAMAFSRGRMLVQAEPLPTLVVPVQAEIGRIVEDCRG